MGENIVRLQQENTLIEEENAKKSEQIQFALNFVEFTREKAQNLEDFEKKY